MVCENHILHSVKATAWLVNGKSKIHHTLSNYKSHPHLDN